MSEKILMIQMLDKRLTLESNMKSIINRADIIGGLKSVELAKKNPQYYQPGVGVTKDFKLKK